MERRDVLGELALQVRDVALHEREEDGLLVGEVLVERGHRQAGRTRRRAW